MRIVNSFEDVETPGNEDMMTWQKFQEPSIYEFYDAKSLDPHVDAG